MRDDATPPNLGQSKEAFDKRFFYEAFRSLELFFTKILSLGPIRVTTVDATDVRASGDITAGGDVAATGGMSAATLRLSSVADAALASTGHAFQIGPTSGVNVIIDNNEIMARSNGVASPLYLNFDGGPVRVGPGGFSSEELGAINVPAAGTLLNFSIANVLKGSITVDGAGVVSYGAFLGTHWSQLVNGARTEILQGTIVESIDTMCAWPGEGAETRLPRFKVSTTLGSPAVYGVFHMWDDEWHETNDALIASLGAYVIRMIAPVAAEQYAAPQIGDYIESAGNGCGRVMSAQQMRPAVVAKITSTHVVRTYPDGSYLLPCTLHCG